MTLQSYSGHISREKWDSKEKHPKKFIAALFRKAKTKQPKCPSREEWMNNLNIAVHEEDCNDAIRSNMDGLDSVLLREISQTEKEEKTYHILYM